MRPYQMSPEKRRELSEIVTIFNFSDTDFVRKAQGEMYRVKARSVRELPMSHAYVWFGNPAMRDSETKASAAAWEKHIRHLTHQYLKGDETSIKNSFFHKYILTGQIGCLQLLQRFVEKSGMHVNPDLPEDEQRAQVARAYYGKTMTEDAKINDGGRPLDMADMVMFSQRRLAPGEQVRELSEEDVKTFTAGMFGTAKTPTHGLGDTLNPGGLLSAGESNSIFSAVAAGAR